METVFSIICTTVSLHQTIKIIFAESIGKFDVLGSERAITENIDV